MQYERPEVDKSHIFRHLDMHDVSVFVSALIKSHIFTHPL